MKAFEYVHAKSVEEAVKALPADAPMDKYGRKVYLKAGGIDLIDQMKEGQIEPERLINLRGAEEQLRYIKAEGDWIKIGALATMAEVAKNAILRERCPAMAQAAAAAATPQIRSVATVGGNLCQRPRCWYFRNSEFLCLKKGGDVCFAKEGENQYHAIFGNGPSYIVHPSNLGPAVVATGSEIEVKNSKGGRVIKAADFFVLPDQRLMAENVLGADEIITEVRVPAGIKQSANYEIYEKQSYDWPLVGAAVALGPKGWSVVLGAVAPMPWRAAKSEEVLGAKAITAELAAQAGEAATAGATPLRYNRYKVELVKVAVRRALMKAAGMEVPA